MISIFYREDDIEPTHVNTRLTPRPTIVCVRQEDLDRERLRELTLQREDLMFAQATAADGPAHEAAIQALMDWTTSNGHEFDKLRGK